MHVVRYEMHMTLHTLLFIKIFCLILIGSPATSNKGTGSYRDRMSYKSRLGDYASDHYNYGSPRNRTFRYPDYSAYDARAPYHNSSYSRYTDRYNRPNDYQNRDRNSAYSYKNLTISRNYNDDDYSNDYNRGTYKNLTISRDYYSADDYGNGYNRGTYRNKSYDDYGPVRNLYKTPIYPYYDTSPLTCPKCPDCPPTCPTFTSTSTAAPPTPRPEDDDESSTPAPTWTNSDGLLSLKSGCEMQPPSDICYLKKQSTPFRCTVEECAATSQANPKNGIKIFAPAELAVSRCIFRKSDTFLFTYDVCQLPKADISQYVDLSKPIKSFVCGGMENSCFSADKTRVVVSNLKTCGSSISSSLTPIELQCTLKLADGGNFYDSASVNVTVLPDCQC